MEQHIKEEISKLVHENANTKGVDAIAKQAYIKGMCFVVETLNDFIEKEVKNLKNEINDLETELKSEKEAYCMGYAYLEGGEINENIFSVQDQDYAILLGIQHFNGHLEELEKLLKFKEENTERDTEEKKDEIIDSFLDL